jgi:hypothetical protein
MEHEHRNCPRCGKPAGDFHFCPSCLAPVDSPSVISTSQTLSSQRSLAASGGDRSVGHDSTAVLQVESEGPSADDVTAEPSGPEAELQLHLDGRASVAPTAQRDVARLEDVLTIGAKPAQPRVSVPPPASREVARLEDVLTVRPAEDAAQISPKTAAAAEAKPAPVVEIKPAPVVEVTPAPDVEAKPRTTPERKAAERRYVPAYALRAAFWFEQASAFEAGSDDEDDEVVVPEPEVEMVQVPVDLTADQVLTGEIKVETPRNRWMVALVLTALAGLVVALTGRRPCRCSCHGSK